MTDVLAHEKVDAFAEQALEHLGGAWACILAGFGDRLGLFKDLAARGPATSTVLAERNGLHERYVREWCRGMVAAGYLHHDPVTGGYALPAEHAPVLAEEAGPYFFGPAFSELLTHTAEEFTRLFDAFRSGGGIAITEMSADIHDLTARFTAPWFEHLLTQEWLPLMPHVDALLERGAAVADVGCGQGLGVVKLALAYPNSTFVGYDLVPCVLERARERAEAAGVSERVRFEQCDVSLGLPERYDVITTFDVVHDSVDPQGLLRAIHDALRPDGRYVCVDIRAAERPEDNVGPLATLLYGSSITYCMTVSLAEGGAGLGTLGLPESRLAGYARHAGFSSVRRLEIDDPFNSVYELVP